MTRVLLIRHGESLANRQSIFAGQINPPLTDLGKTQAERTAKFIKENYTVDAAYASDLDRAWETGLAAANALGLPLHKEPGFREIHAGQWEGQRFDNLNESTPAEYLCWFRDIGNAVCPGGESTAQLADRVFRTLEAVCEKHPDQTVLIATHATPIRTLMWRLTGQPLSYMQQVPWVSNASVTEICYENGTLTPVKISQDSHLSDIKTELPANI